MPLYEYKCEECGKTFEINQKFSDEPATKCRDDDCKGKVKKVIFASTFDLRGSGWFKSS